MKKEFKAPWGTGTIKQTIEVPDKKEFNLSENKLYGYAGCNPELQEDLSNIPKEDHENWMAVYPEKDIKEFIKKLKEEMFKSWQENKWSYQLIKYKIDKLAGEDLI